MPQPLRIILAQLNLHVGNITHNLQKHIDAANTARDEYQANLIVFPELSLCGYPPEDLLLRPSFIKDCEKSLQTFAAQAKGIYCCVGHPFADGGKLYNACSIIHDGKILATYAKLHLPNYGVFDEKRYFDSAKKTCVINIAGTMVGVVICEDVWSSGPVEATVAAGAQVVIVPNASPFVADKHEQRLEVISEQAKQFHVPIVYVNNVGGQDELVFDGGSMVVNDGGKMVTFSGFFHETLTPFELTPTPHPANIYLPNKLERIYQALVTGTRDYIEKNRIPGVLIGISGGIDSALTAAIAVDALGADRVQGVLMPTRYTSEVSYQDAGHLAALLGIELTTISIDENYQQFKRALANDILDAEGITDQNIQSRCRCIVLMALSNATGKLVLTTGNRSELAVGYCTLYGDMSGGYAPIKNVPKTLVYQLAEYRNTIATVIPVNTIRREPTAELAPNQKDEDTLPPYSILDGILELYLNRQLGIDEIVAAGYEQSVVTRVIKMVVRNEYKRRQYAVGPQIYPSSFCKDWRYPITNGYSS